ncbi:hypothetical protein HYC85_016557 [Camellia sinensis]|uniref:Uncharacterized protein n=1 Tax=Camellia sinensis TaxID=4442 RepID=A0A7J7H006_CAMSI|nr:hypothetical protein HYC85_016557 [Camellia sinensis]
MLSPFLCQHFNHKTTTMRGGDNGFCYIWGFVREGRGIGRYGGRGRCRGRGGVCNCKRKWKKSASRDKWAWGFRALEEERKERKERKKMVEKTIGLFGLYFKI